MFFNIAFFVLDLMFN